ncbi:acyl-CoA N-acyltransferase [Cladochytrium replicatum]|nr:acyl-CoA N-acyltransferase [Cladochytrium replicatum]
MFISLTHHPPTHPDALALLADLTNDLARRYPVSHPGAANYIPEREALLVRAAFIVARIDGRPCGCGALVPFKFTEPNQKTVEPWDARVDLQTTTIAELKRMWVADWARGKGVAKAIANELETFAKVNGYSQIRLVTGIGQPEAIALYRRIGYVSFPKYGNYLMDNDLVCFEKQLDGN